HVVLRLVRADDAAEVEYHPRHSDPFCRRQIPNAATSLPSATVRTGGPEPARAAGKTCCRRPAATRRWRDDVDRTQGNAHRAADGRRRARLAGGLPALSPRAAAVQMPGPDGRAAGPAGRCSVVAVIARAGPAHG